MNHPFAKANRRLLVIDDNRAIHADFRKILCPVNGGHSGLADDEMKIFGSSITSYASPTGFHLDSAFQGQEGCALVEKALAGGKPYSVVFTDVRMPPGWDGIETAANIWGAAPDTQVVICTAYSDYSWDEMITRLGISDRLVILKKPFDNMEVIQLAHALTEKWRLRQEARLKLEQMEAMVAERTQELQLANDRLRLEMNERERTEDALRQSQKMQALGQLAGGIAHDFNNLLTVIRGNVDSLLADGNHPQETLLGLQEINEAALRASKLTSQILTFSRKKHLHPEELDLNQLVDQLGQLYQRLLGKNITVEIQCASKPQLVHADPGMMEQVLVNLATNARDAMPLGGNLRVKTCRVEINSEQVQASPQARVGQFVCVSVADTGTGIPPAVLPRIFEPFFTTKEPGKGTGLGLATVYGIVQQHHGWIEVDNQPGAGVTFKIYLPCAERQKANTDCHHSADCSATSL